MMSLVVTKLNGVAWLSRARAPSHDFGSSNDGSPARDSARAHFQRGVGYIEGAMRSAMEAADAVNAA